MQKTPMSGRAVELRASLIASSEYLQRLSRAKFARFGVLFLSPVALLLLAGAGAI